ncbi:hypothetical protein M5C98_18620 [Acidovorax sp. NCPPB 3576]|nr:hypothetical protein [Acidovorax sp. NCPPB 3576]WCM87349.1 hypothetical protein M5C98_18620 [Acidovorax sp. NCPPB 3576]
MPLRQRQEVQELPRPSGLITGHRPDARAGCRCAKPAGMVRGGPQQRLRLRLVTGRC